MAAAIILMIAAPAHAETYEYDELNRLTKVNYENGTVVEYTYDAAGNMLSSNTIPGLTVDEVKAEDGKISGKAVAGSTIKVFADGVELGVATAGEDRSFVVPVQNLQDKQELSVQAIKDGNVFAEVSVTVGAAPVTTKPAPAPPKVGTIDNETSNIVGTAEPGTTVKIYSDGEVIATGTANDEGVFTIKLPEDVQAGKELEVVTTDEEGKESESTKVTVVDKEDRTPSISADSIKITNNQTLIDDEITVENLAAGDIVTIYGSATGTEVLARQTVPEGQTSVKLQIEELGKEAGSVFVSVTESGKAESKLTEVTYEKEPGGTEKCLISNILYGTKLAAAIPVLQDFRDDVLMKSSMGQAFVKGYYDASPTLISLIR